jgi:hypothetical protein
LPAFADPNLPGTGRVAASSPTHSWSRSPQNAEFGKRIALKRPEEVKEEKIEDGVQSERKSLGHVGSLHSAPSADSRFEESQTMELEEGYFRVTLLNGDTALLQHGEIVDLIRKAELPDGWSAYRDSDHLWISVYKADQDDTSNAAGADDKEIDRKSDEWTTRKGMLSVMGLQREQQAPGLVREEFFKTARESHAAIQHKMQTPALHYARRVSTQKPAKAASADFQQAAGQAATDLSAYNRLLVLRSNAKLLCGAPKPIDASTRAMIKGRVIEDRVRLKDVASGALQKALRLFIQRRKSTQ